MSGCSAHLCISVAEQLCLLRYGTSTRTTTHLHVTPLKVAPEAFRLRHSPHSPPPEQSPVRRQQHLGYVPLAVLFLFKLQYDISHQPNKKETVKSSIVPYKHNQPCAAATSFSASSPSSFHRKRLFVLLHPNAQTKVPRSRSIIPETQR